VSTTNTFAESTGAINRRSAVLDSALTTFARYGYRKSSMEEVARAARISRPGLYFLFSSKEELFRAAVSQTLEDDLAQVDVILGSKDRPLADRMLDAFDRWAGRYIGPMARDISAVMDDNPDLLGDLVTTAPLRFRSLVATAIAASGPKHSDAVTDTLISAAIGIKHQAQSREDYRERLAVAIGLLLR
jgi:AcrR family transcriptional regulator